MNSICRLIAVGIVSSLMSLAALAQTVVKMETSQGNIVIELADKQAPVTVKNFLGYVNSGFYNGTIFHRTIGGFMIQGGGFTAKMDEKKTGAPIINEARNGLTNNIGTIAMARTNDPNSATAQFFINVANNDFLNAAPSNPGYAVFGKVIDGMDVVSKIAAVPTRSVGFHQDVPKDPVIIRSVTVTKPAK